MVTSRSIVNNRQERKWNRHVAKKINGDEQKNSGSENMKSVIGKRLVPVHYPRTPMVTTLNQKEASFVKVFPGEKCYLTLSL